MSATCPTTPRAHDSKGAETTPNARVTPSSVSTALSSTNSDSNSTPSTPGT